MSLWFFLALMTAAAVFAVLWPLGRSRASAAAATGHGAEVAVYRDQLDEVERDRGSGLIAGSEAHAARAEIARRLIAAADAAEPAPARQGSSLRRRRAVALAALLLIPLGGGALYATLGSPGLPSARFASGEQAPLDRRPIAALVAQVEAHLAKHPEDGRGWEVVAPVYLRLGRFDDAVTARRNALRLGGATAAREADLGEALVFAASGVVTGEAKEAFDRALKLDAGEVKARYFQGLAAEQDGRTGEAAATWRALLADAPAGAAWSEVVRAALARVDPQAGAPGPSAADMAAAESMAPEERTKMVRGMVARLAARLREDGSDIEGWLRLVRAHVVLGEPEQARAAAIQARKASAGDEAKLRRLDELMKTLGLET